MTNPYPTGRRYPNHPCAVCGNTHGRKGDICTRCEKAGHGIALRDEDGAWRFDPFRRTRVWVKHKRAVA